MSFDVHAVREQFPILSRKVHGRPLVYLDNAASAQKPDAVIDAMAGAMRHSYANVHRGLHALANEATEAFEAARSTVARFINAPSPETIVFTRGATAAINIVAAGLDVRAGDEIVLSVMEHHSNIVPWHFLRERKGAVLKWLDVGDDGEIDLDALDALIGPRTSLEADFYAFSSHKLYGPTGIGVLYGKPERLAALAPFEGGGEMIETVTRDRVTYNAPPHRFEAGTPPIIEAVGLRAAIDWLASQDGAAIAAHEHGLRDRLVAGLRNLNWITLYGDAPDTGAIVAFNMEGAHPHDVAQIVDRHGVAIRAGHHCAQPLMTRLGVSATARASLALYNTAEDVDVFLDALVKARKMLA
ncbi:MAG: cysteine desulfurase / selenocysteine lyase [Alphaproteobacteria bacterium]|nr:MAG: cysteine desulfurase / selenocysteine lyase [Alphaproteobacteria bacterium]